MGYARCLLLSLVTGFFLTASLEAAHLHVILVADSLNNEDPTGFEGGVDLWLREAKKIGAYAGLELNGAIFEGHHCRIHHILDYMDQLVVEPDDVVILYFAMHGSRSPNKNNQWPDLSFSLDQQKIDFNTFNGILKEKNPRLLLSIADSCNNIVTSRADKKVNPLSLEIEEEDDHFESFENTASYATLLVKNTPVEVVGKYRRLFLDHSGSIVVSTSSPGQFSIKHCLTGGIFTSQLIETLRKKARCPIQDVSWEAILTEVTKQTTKKVETLKDELALEEVQIPQFELDLF